MIRKLRQSGKRKIYKKLAAFRRLSTTGNIDEAAIKRSMVSLEGHLSHGHTYHLRKKISNSINNSPERKEEHINEKNKSN